VTRQHYVRIASAILYATLGHWPAAVQAQSGATSGQITGVVLDASDAAIASAEVTVRNSETSYQRTVTTDDSGRFIVQLVPVGTYAIEARAGGFEPSSREIAVSLGASRSENFQLQVASQRETTRVTAEGSSLEPTGVPSKAVLTELQIHNLPANGRRVMSFLLLTPTATRTAFSDPDCRGISISGQQGIYTNISVDGADYNSTFGGGVRGRSESAPTFAVEALQELQVIRNVFSTEFGRSTGGVVNMSTRSGTNLMRGTALYLLRDGALSARDAFGAKSEAHVDQFGGAFGGPLAKDRSFFFVATEFQNGRKPVQTMYSNLDVQGVRNTPGAQLLQLIAPEDTFNAESDAQMFVGRIDHRFTDNHSMFARSDYVRTSATYNPSAGANILSTGPSIETITNVARSSQTLRADRNTTAMGQFTSVLSQTRMNELRVSFAREYRPHDPIGRGPNVVVRNAGSVIGSYGPVASSSSFNNLSFQSSDDRYQLVNNFSVVNGAHSAKFGVDFTRISGHIMFNGGNNGSYDFNSLADFLARRPRRYSQFTGTGDLDLAINHFALYAQEEWRMRPTLTISPGLRWDAQFNPDYADATMPQKRYPGATSIPDDTKMFAPRLGVAWNPGGGRTVVRAGTGLFYATSLMSMLAQGMLFNGGNPNMAHSVVVTDALALANAFRSIGIDLAGADVTNLPVFSPAQLHQLFGGPEAVSGLSVNYVDPNLRNPRALHFQLGAERELGSGVMAGMTFTDINTTWIARQRDTNLPVPVVDATGRRVYSGVRPLPQFSVAQVAESSSRAHYRSVVSTINVRKPSFTVDGSYTLGWNRTFDDIERSFNINYDDPLNMANDYGYSNIDERHQFIANGVYFLPKAFQVAATARFTSGRPFSASAGSDLNRDGQVRDRAIVNGEVLERNTFRNRGVSDLSIRMQRGFTMPGNRGTLMLSAELFNVFGFDNYLLGGASTSYGAGTIIQNGVAVTAPPSAAFGQARDANGNYLRTGSVGDPMQVQFGLRWQF